MDKNLTILAPITKVEKLDDGSVLVEGVATSEALDTDGEVVGYEASKAAFGRWTSMFKRMTGGKSLGNIREMHGPVAAGKAIAWHPSDDDKSITLRAKVVDAGSAAKVNEGVLSMFSINAPGETVKRENRTIDGRNRPFITKYDLLEVSLVDAGANPDSAFSIVKRAKPAELLETLKKGLEDLRKVDLEKLAKPAGKDGELKKNAAQAAEMAMQIQAAHRELLAMLAQEDYGTEGIDLKQLVEATEVLAEIQGALAEAAALEAEQAADGEGDPPAGDPPADPPAPPAGDPEDPAAVAARRKAEEEGTDPPMPPKADGEAGDEEKPVMAMLKAVTGIQEAIDSQARTIKALSDKAASGNDVRKVQTAVEDLAKRTKALEEQPARVGRPALPATKSIGHAGAKSQAQIDLDVQAEALNATLRKAVAAGDMDKRTAGKLREDMAEQMMRASNPSPS